MRATLNGHVIAESEQIEIGADYQYFPPSATLMSPPLRVQLDPSFF